MSLRKSWVRLSCQATLQHYEHRRDQGVTRGVCLSPSLSMRAWGRPELLLVPTPTPHKARDSLQGKRPPSKPPADPPSPSPPRQPSTLPATIQRAGSGSRQGKKPRGLQPNYILHLREFPPRQYSWSKEPSQRQCTSHPGSGLPGL